MFMSSAQDPPASVVDPPETLSPAARCYACRHFTLQDLSWISRQLLFNFFKSFFLEDKSDFFHVPFHHNSFKSDSTLMWEVSVLMNVVHDAGHMWPIHHCDLHQVWGAYRPLWRQKLAHITKALDAFHVTVVEKWTEKAFCTFMEIKMLATAS